MKKSILTAIFALGFGTMGFATDVQPTESNVLLVRSNEAAFTQYMSKKAKRFIARHEQDWKIFNDVVTMYNETSSKFLTMSAEEQQAFLQAASRIEKNLDKMRGAEVEAWKNKVVVTSNVFNYLWNSTPVADQNFASIVPPAAN